MPASGRTAQRRVGAERVGQVGGALVVAACDGPQGSVVGMNSIALYTDSGGERPGKDDVPALHPVAVAAILLASECTPLACGPGPRRDLVLHGLVLRGWRDPAQVHGVRLTGCC